MGLPPLPLGALREQTEQCRALLRGEEVLYRDGQRQRWIKFLHPDRGYINLTDPIPIYIAANGPKALALTGELADGWITTLSEPDSFQKIWPRSSAGRMRSDGRPAACPTPC